MISDQVVPELLHQRLQTICSTNTPTVGKRAVCSLKTKHFIKVSALPHPTVPEDMDAKNVIHPAVNAEKASDKCRIPHLSDVHVGEMAPFVATSDA